jgi:hypothetical protein
MLQSCSNIAGEEATTYETSSLDVGRYIRFVVTATNIHGSQIFYSASSPIVIAKVVNLVAPSISGSATAGQRLTASNGIWEGKPTFTYQWYSCNQQHQDLTSLPAGCVAISRATTATFVPNSTHIGKYLLVAVTGTNAASSSRVFQQTSVIR